MGISIIATHDFDRILSLSEKAARDLAIASDTAFAAAMVREIKRGRLKVTPGTFVDRTPAIGARHIRGELPMSSFGSPAAMCVDATGSPNGAQSMK